ncbi:MAG: hypothetical protein AB7I27_02795 [Bacteriovoracaceae bacterium]
MKFTLGMISLLMCTASFASTGESRRVIYDGSQSTFELSLTGQKTHIEYTSEPRPSICTRIDYVGSRRVCPNVPNPDPRSCRDVPITHPVSYPCTRIEQIPHDIKDYDVDVRVSLSMTKPSEVLTSGESIEIKVLGDEVSIEATGSKKFFLVLKNKNEKSSMQGSVKMMDVSYEIELIEALPILKALSIEDMNVENNFASFNLGSIADSKHLGVALNVTKAPIFGFNKTLFDRELTQDEMVIESVENKTNVKIDLSKLGVEIDAGRFHVVARAFLKVFGTVLNADQFPGLEVSRKVTIKK